MLSDTLKALLVYCKSPRLLEADERMFTWDKVAKVLEPLYSPDMKLVDVLHIVMKAYVEAVEERQFCMKSFNDVLARIAIAPVQGTNAIDMFGPPNGIKTQYTVEQFYNAILAQMLSELRFTRVDWLRKTPAGEFLDDCFTEKEKGEENGNRA